jgi:hypothetical protein
MHLQEQYIMKLGLDQAVAENQEGGHTQLVTQCHGACLTVFCPHTANHNPCL